MGVKNLAQWLVQHYPLCTTNSVPPPQPFQIMLIDMPNYISGDFRRSLEPRSNRAVLVTRAINNIDRMIQWVKPHGVIFFSFEAQSGLQPYAKLITKRFRSQKRAKQAEVALQKQINANEGYVCGEDDISMSEMHPEKEFVEFDKEVAPTFRSFMRAFCDEWEQLLHWKMRNDPAYMGKQIIVSNHMVPGEADHKIMDYLRDRTNSPDWNPETNVCICSNDNDLILLALQTHIANISILKHVDYRYRGWMINVSVVRDYLGMEFGVKDKELADTIDDLVAMEVILENDFVPSFPDIAECKTDQLIAILKSLCQANPGHHMFRDCRFDVDFISQFLQAVANEMVPDEEERQADLLRFCEWYPDAPIEEMATDMFRTIAWAFYLYKTGCPSFTHHYRFCAVPPLTAVMPYVDRIDVPREEFIGEPKFISRDAMILIVEPLTRRKGLSPTIQQLLQPGSKVADLLPNGDATKDKHAPLPPIDVNRVVAAVDELSPPDRPVVPRENYMLVDRGKNSIRRPDFVSCFRWSQPGRKHLLAPEFTELDRDFTPEKAHQLVGKLVFAQWPYKIPAVVQRIADDIPDQKKVKMLRKFKIEPSDEQEHVFLVVRLMLPSQKLASEEKFEFGPSVREVPPLVASTLPYAQPLVPGLKVVTPEGYSGSVYERVDNSNVTVGVRPPINLGDVIEEDKKNWMTQKEFAEALGITEQAVSLMSYRLVLMPDRTNMSMKLYTKHFSRVLAGYCKMDGDSFLFSVDAMEIARKWLDQPSPFKELIEESAVKLQEKALAEEAERLRLAEEAERQRQLEEEQPQQETQNEGEVANEENEIQPDIDNDSEEEEHVYPIASEEIDGSIVLPEESREEILLGLKEYFRQYTAGALSHFAFIDGQSLSISTVRELEGTIRRAAPHRPKTITCPSQELICERDFFEPWKDPEDLQPGMRVVVTKTEGYIPFGSYGTIFSIDPSGFSAIIIFDRPVVAEVPNDLSNYSLRGNLKQNLVMMVNRRILKPITGREPDPPKGSSLFTLRK